MSTTKTASVVGVGVALALAATSCTKAAQAEDEKAKAKEKTAKQGKTTKDKVDPKADEILREMSSDLANTKTFQVDAEHVHEVVTKEGEKLQVLAQARIGVQRPNKMRSDRIGAIADVALYYDGKTVAIYGKRTKLYATAKAPAKIDDMIGFARDQLGLEAPGADLLYSDAYSGLMEDVVSGRYLGTEPVGDRLCHHLAYRGNETDWQIWIEDGENALPCRYVITSKKVKGQPQYEVAFFNWDTSPDLPADHFTFTPPDDAEQIEFLSTEKVTEPKPTKKTGSKP